MTQFVNEQTFMLLSFYQFRHHNRGYVRDEHGETTGVHAGYAWTMKCVELPRISFTDYYMMPDRAPYRSWRVDGEKVGPEVGEDDMPPPEWYERINQPPVLTLPEFVCWLRIGPGRIPHDRLLDTIAGAKSDQPHVIERDPWSRAYRLYEQLVAKDLVAYDKDTDEVWRKDP